MVKLTKKSKKIVLKMKKNLNVSEICEKIDENVIDEAHVRMPV